MLYNVAQLLKAPMGADLRQPIAGTVQLDSDDATVVSPVAGEARFQHTNQGVLASGEFAVTVRMPCVRCLEMVEIPLTVPFSEMFIPTLDVVTGRPLPPITEEQGFPIDARHHLDLTELMRQQIILVLPTQPLCRADCAGLCTICGVNLNQNPGHAHAEVDNRWEALVNLTLNDLPDQN